MRIKICGIFREQDIDYINEAHPDYCGFVFAESKRQISAVQAANLRRRLADGITAVGVFVNAPIDDIAALYRDGVIDIAQLHGDEGNDYIERLKKASGKSSKEPIPIITAIKIGIGEQGSGSRDYCSKYDIASELYLDISKNVPRSFLLTDYYLIDSGAGSGKPFNWDLLNPRSPIPDPRSPTPDPRSPTPDPRPPLPDPRSLFKKPWFLAGGINLSNIAQAMAVNPFGIDISSGAETGGIKDREKILQLVATVHKGNTV